MSLLDDLQEMRNSADIEVVTRQEDVIQLIYEAADDQANIIISRLCRAMGPSYTPPFQYRELIAAYKRLIEEKALLLHDIDSYRHNQNQLIQHNDTLLQMIGLLVHSLKKLRPETNTGLESLLKITLNEKELNKVMKFLNKKQNEHIR